jgi:thioredoxin reductase
MSSISVLIVGAGIGAHSAAVHCTAVDSGVVVGNVRCHTA